MIELTNGEQRVYDAFVNTGLSNKGLAKYLNISPLTVQTYMLSLFHKFEVGNRVQLAIRHYKDLR